MDKNIHRLDYNFNFSINHELRVLKQKGRIIDSKLHVFKMEAKSFISTLCIYLTSESPLTSYLARYSKSLNPIYMAAMPNTCEKVIDLMFQKLVDCNHIISSVAGAAAKEYKKFLYTVVKESKTFL